MTKKKNNSDSEKNLEKTVSDVDTTNVEEQPKVEKKSKPDKRPSKNIEDSMERIAISLEKLVDLIEEGAEMA